jgi:hypothetical protein
MNLNLEERPSTDPVSRIHCPMCAFGVLSPSRLLYFTTEANRAVCIPDFPAWTCDICRYSEYDPKALAELSAIYLSGISRSTRPPRWSSTTDPGRLR